MKPRISSLRTWGILFSILNLFAIAPTVLAQSGLLREFYSGIPGNNVADLTSAPIFPDRPTSRGLLTEFFETGPDEADNYGQRIRGYLDAPQTGDYVFWIASDDQSVLYLSTDEDSANKRIIATVNGATGFRDWFAEANQQSAPVHLESGRLYYVEVLMKEGVGGDHFSARWLTPQGGIEEPIAASYFVPFGTVLFPPEITRQPASVTVAEGESATFRVQVRNADLLTYQWQRNNQPIPGAQGPVLVLPRVSRADDGARFRCTLSNSQGVVVSGEAVLTVTPDIVPPRLAAVYNTSLGGVLVRFTEPVAPATALLAANYVLNPSVAITQVLPGTTPDEILLQTAPLTPNAEYELTVSRVTDAALSPNAVLPGTSLRFTILTLVPTSLGTLPAISEVQSMQGGLNITAVGRGLTGTRDQAHFSYQVRNGDFDVRVRVESLQLGTLFAQAGLLVRQNLSSNSPFAAAIATPSVAGTSFNWRSTTGAVTRASGSFPVNFPATWLRLRRAGTNFSGFASDDGAAWSALGTAAIGMSNSVYLGFVVGSGSTNRTVAAAFRDFDDVDPAAPRAILPEGLEPLGPANRRTGLVISEIMYHPIDRPGGAPLEYVEIFNSDSVFIDLSGFRLSGDVDYAFPVGTRIPAGGFLVVARAQEDLATAYGITGVFGPWQGVLPHDVGTLRLRNPAGAVLFEVEYADSAPWPVAADGAGHSLVLARPSYGEADPHAWAASERRGGSPGGPESRVGDPLRTVVISEVLARTDEPAVDFIELYNRGTHAVDLSNAILTDDPLVARFRIPAGTLLAPGAYVAWDQTQLGFALSAAGEAVYLIDPTEGRVEDAIRFGPQLNGISSGRTPPGADTWRLLAVPSRGAANGPARRSPIVIHELMYHPPPGMEAGEFVELYNRGTEVVNLKDWRFVNGITYAFTNDVLVAPGGYHVVAANATWLLSTHPDLDPARVSGNFDASLADGGEHLALAQPDVIVSQNAAGVLQTNRVFITVDEVAYRDGGRWGVWADGGGSSLELKDPRSDNTLASNWGDSDETAKSAWTNVDFTGLLELGQGDSSELHVMLLAEGECLLDNVEVRDQSGANLVSNSTFDGGLNGWIAQGNHVKSGLSTNGFSSQRALQVRASSGGDNSANRVKTVLANGVLVENAFANFKARARWQRGDSYLLLRLKGNYLETVVHLPIPSNLGTPGAPNSRRVANAGPAIHDVTHAPVVPAALEPVTVTARVDDPDGLAAVRLKFRFDPSVTVRDLPMRDDGTEGDAVAGDGLYSARIPGQAAGVLVAFWVEANDGATPSAQATFPENPAAGECLVRFGDTVSAGSFATYRLWMTQRNTDIWTQREALSNEALDGTIVYGTSRAIYNGGARYRGSPFIRPGYDSPTGNLCAYVWNVPDDDLLLGADELNLDWLEQPGRDPTLQRERISFWIGSQLGVPYSHQRYVELQVNGVRRGEVYADTQQPNADYIGSWFSDAPEGEIFKIDDWFEFSPDVRMEFNVDARLQSYDDSQGRPHKTRYRWNWEKKANHGIDDDYSHLLALVDAVNLPEGDLYTRRVQEMIDPDGWLRTIATRRVVGDWDGYGYNRGKNTFAYVPPGGRWHLLLWDLDFSLGGGSDGPSTGIFHANDPTMERLYANPFFHRIYLQAISDAIRGPLALGAADPLMDANYEAFIGNRIQVEAPAPIKSWIAARREFLSRILTTNTAPWTIAGAADGITTADSVVTLTGTAPIDVRSIGVNGNLYAPSWTTPTNWVLRLPVRAGVNTLALTGVDRLGNPVPGASRSIEVRNTGVDERPEDFIRFSEIMFEPLDFDAEFVELHNRSTRTTYDLSGWRVTGIDYDFPGGVSLAPGAYLVLVKDRQAFESVHGAGLPVLGPYPGRLNNAGEALRLLRPGTVSEPFVVINQLTYSGRPPWPARAAGAGGSLQVVDVAQDNRRPANWAAVDAGGHGYSRWRFVSATDRATASVLRIRLSAPGTVHIDDVSLVAGVVPRVGTDLVQNGGFESALGTLWIADPEYATSALDPAVRRSGLSSLRIVVDPEAFSGSASVHQALSVPVVSGELYTLSFWYLADGDGADLTVQLDGGVAATVDAVEEPVAAATPGAASSVQATLTPIPDVWINEVSPVGLGGTAPGWIELFNGGAAQVSLSGWSLSRDPSLADTWNFPAGTVLGPGAFLVVTADGAGQGGPGLHSPFTLAQGSGSVVLARAGDGVPAAIDYVHYEGLAPGRSIGSFPDGAWLERQVFEVPTPGAPNDPSSLPVHLAINEWMARNTQTIADPADGDYDDWIEIYNAGDEAVDLSGYSMSDNPADPRKAVFPSGFIIAPRGVLLVWADGEPDQNAPGRHFHADFGLSFGGDSIALFSPGGSMVDFVTFGPQERDISEGLTPDGALGSIKRQTVPSPGLLNTPSSSDEIRITSIQRDGPQVRLTWSSAAGKIYRVQVAQVLGQAWIDLEPPVTASGATASATDTSGIGGTTRFYRIVRITP